jgi:small-conductance mechanosensitive channel
MLFPIFESRTEILILGFSEFKDLLHSYSPSKLARFQEDYALKHSMLGKVAVERLVEQEKANKQLSQKSKELKWSFALAQSANIELEKKVAELAEALKISQDEKKLVESALEQSKKELEKVQKSHEDDLSVIENLRGKHERAMKIAEDLRTNNASLAKSLSTKDRKIQDLEKALAEQNEASKRNTSEILEKLKLLYEEYKKSLNEFGVRLAPLPDNIEIPEFMDWMETEFQALSEVISGASDFAAAFSVESILKILHDYDCADLAKFRDAISQFPSATSTSIIRTNADVQAIKNKFAREFWLTSGKEVVKVIARAKLAEVVFCLISSLVPAIDVSVSRIPFTFAFLSFSAERGGESREYRCISRRVNFRRRFQRLRRRGFWRQQQQ